MRFLSIIALAAPLASAIQFTSPSAGQTLGKGTSFDLTWTSVDTDPAAFSLFLVNFLYWPPLYGFLDSATTSDGHHSVTIPCNIDAQDGYQINAINGTNVYVIYAQTPKFSVGGSTCSSPTIDKNSNGCAPAGTVTVTSTATETVRVEI